MKFKVVTFLLSLIIVVTYSCQSEQELEFKRYYAAGARVYQMHCQNCHGPSGEGLAALYPPLTDSASLKKNINKLPCFVKNGLNGPIAVNGKVFNNQMPADDLPAVEIAEVLTYINNSFGNKLGVYTTPQVEEWLKGCGVK
jgi:mono/diheme cytochrome c family protein